MIAMITQNEIDASLLLANARGRMTGREIEVCERISDGEIIKDKRVGLRQGHPERRMVCDGEIFIRLKNQFYVELAEWREEEDL